MNGPFVVAQAGSSSSNSAKAPVQIIKIKKPALGETDIYHASFTGTVKIDLTDIANEKVTFYKDQANQSLHILFLDGNKVVAQAIIEPFFDSMGVLSNLTFDVGPGPDLDAQQFSSQFTFSTDQSILPAAGNASPLQGSLDFAPPAVDPLAGPEPLPLLPQEELPTFVLHETIAVLPTSEAPPTTLSFVIPDLRVDESFIPAIGSFSGSPGVQSLTTGPLSVDISNPVGPTTFGLFLPQGPGTVLVLHDSETGSAIELYLNGTTLAEAYVQGHVGDPNYLVFTIEINDATGALTLTVLRGLVDPTPGTQDDLVQAASDVLFVTATNNGVTVSFDLGPHITLVDDAPLPPTVSTEGTESALVTYDGGLANGNFVGPEAAGDSNPSPTIATQDLSGVFFIASEDVGADLPGSTVFTSYSLQLHAGFVEGAVSGLFSGGVAIRLYESGGVITGSTALTEGGINAGNTVFTLSVASGTGVVTLTQFDTIDHTQTDTYTGSYINDVQFLPNGEVDLTATATTTDSDGDQASGSGAFDLGGLVQFGDDGPTAPTVVLSQTEPIAITFDGGLANGNFVGPEGAGDSNVSPIIAAVNFSGAFTIGSQNDFGADGGGSTTISYSLQLHAGFVEGAVSGLFSGGVAIRPYESGGVITGSTALTEGGINAGNTVFTLSVASGTGVVTLTQFDTIDHTQTDTYNNAYINDVQSLANSLVDLKATATTTDSEGDNATGSALLDLGGNIQFGDDGPQAPTVVLSQTEPIAITFDGGLANGNFVGPEGAGDSNVSPIIAAVNFSGAFTIGSQNDFGADGGGSTTISYSLQLHAGFVEGAVSGLFSGGVAIRPYESGGVITGSTALTEGGINAGNTVFTLSVASGTGVVTLTQFDTIDHTQTDTYNNAYINDVQSLANSLVDLKATATTTDSEGDNATGSALLDLGGNIQFGDDGPQAPTVVLSQTEPIAITFDGGLANGNFVGPEGAGDSNVSPIIAAVNFSGAFTIGSQNDFGADGGGSTTISYSLQLHAGFVEGAVSGLFSGGVAIRPYESGGVITGSTALTEGGINAGNTVFTLSVASGTGVVTLTQFDTIDHTQTDTYNNAYINDVQSLANSLVDLKATATTTDSEGDNATGSALLDLGGNIQFGDDGPQAPTVVLSQTEPIAITFDGGLANGNFVGPEGAGDSNVSPIIAAVNFSGAFTI